MTRQIFSIYDSKTEVFSPLMFGLKKGEMIRSFSDFVNEVNSKDSNNDVSKHPEDYTLFHIGEWDDATCKFNIFDTPISVGIAIEFKKSKLEVVK